MRGLRSLIACALLGLAIAATGCSRGMAFEPNKSAFDAAASSLASQSVDAQRWTEVPLREADRKLATDGVAYVFEREGRRFVFFPQSIEEPNFYTGYLVALDGGDSAGLLELPKSLSPGWWSGDLSQQVLAGG